MLLKDRITSLLQKNKVIAFSHVIQYYDNHLSHILSIFSLVGFLFNFSIDIVKIFSTIDGDYFKALKGFYSCSGTDSWVIWVSRVIYLISRGVMLVMKFCKFSWFKIIMQFIFHLNLRDEVLNFSLRNYYWTFIRKIFSLTLLFLTIDLIVLNNLLSLFFRIMRLLLIKKQRDTLFLSRLYSLL